MRRIYVHNGKVLVSRGMTDNLCRLPDTDINVGTVGETFEFTISGEEYKALGTPEEEKPAGYEYVGIRSLWGELSETDYKAIGKGAELIYWDSHTRYCGQCGADMKRCSDISKKCELCGTEVFPSVSPAVIVLIERGDEALLVHARTFSKPFYGLVAGFVETGENLEECVAREIREETGLEVRNIKYFGSQPWPYPSQIMIGFTADYEDGELKFMDGELTSGGFFRKDNLPLLPGKASIARRLIDYWIEKNKY